MNKRLRRELCIWKRLSNVHIIPLCGVMSGFGPYLSMVSPWMEKGDMRLYLGQQNPTTLSTKFQLLCEVAAGLLYLHSSGIVHGDLNPGNVLITDEGKACLSDFGLSTIIADIHGISYITSSSRGNSRWTAPELYIDTKTPASTQSDIYSFGSVMLEVLSGQVPYHGLSEAQVYGCLFESKSPERPELISDGHWAFIQRCWDINPDARPSTQDVLKDVTHLQTCLQDNTPTQLCWDNNHDALPGIQDVYEAVIHRIQPSLQDNTFIDSANHAIGGTDDYDMASTQVPTHNSSRGPYTQPPRSFAGMAIIQGALNIYLKTLDAFKRAFKTIRRYCWDKNPDARSPDEPSGQ